MKRKPPFITIALIVLSVLFVAASGPVGSAIELPSPLKPLAFPLFLGLTILLCLISVAQYFLQQEKPLPPAPSLNQQNRQYLLARVRKFWITDFLDDSLHGAALIALGLQNQPDVLADPWNLVLQERNQSPRALPMGTSITQVYDEAPRELLILGEPGCGKTTLLLELARDLLGRAEQDERHPMPLVFSLSSWAVKRQPLADWLVEEMNTKYQVPRRLAQAWVGADKLLPLLDGLDEVAAPYRAACVECINAFRKEHGLVPVVVCSRSADYLALKPRLLLNCAVIVRPLTEHQIDAYLSGAGRQMESVRIALKDDPVLREMATTPLLLSVLTLTYQGRHVKELAVLESLEMRRRQLFDDYIVAMLQRRSVETRYTAQQTISWLRWLARQMMGHDRTEFYLERLQPDWLLESGSQKLYQRITRLTTGLFVGLITALSFDALIQGLGGNHIGLVIGLVTALFVSLSIKPETEIKPAERAVWSWTRMQQILKRSLLPQNLRLRNFTGTFRSKVPSLLGIMLALGLLGGIIGLIASISTLHWQAQDIAGDLVSIVASILTFALIIAILAPLMMFLALLFYYLIFLLVITGNSSLISGFSSEMLDEQKFTRPNWGIWLSARNSLLIGLSSVLIVVMIETLLFWLFYRLLILLGAQFSCSPNSCNSGLGSLLFVALPFALFFGLRAWLRNGGLACIEHVVLRLLFWRAGSMPWNYSRFLDYATKCIFLRKVGGGYTFVHRLLLEHFASQADRAASSK